LGFYFKLNLSVFIGIELFVWDTLDKYKLKG
jgi:hypothetical protein